MHWAGVGSGRAEANQLESMGGAGTEGEWWRWAVSGIGGTLGLCGYPGTFLHLSMEPGHLEIFRALLTSGPASGGFMS